MYCPKCGTEAGGNFCPNCGSKMTARPEPQAPADLEDEPTVAFRRPAPPSQQPNNQAGPAAPRTNPGYAPQGGYENPGSAYPPQSTYMPPQNPGYQAPVNYPPQNIYVNTGNPNGGPGPVETVRQVAGSPLFLIATLLATAGVILSFVFSLTNPGSMVSFLPNDLARELRNSQVVTAVISLILSGLMPLGLILTYCSARSRNGMKTGGLTLIQVMLTIVLVLVCIAVAACVVIFIIALAQGEQELRSLGASLGDFLNVAFDSEVGWLLILSIVLTVVAFTLMICFVVGLVNTVRRVKMTIRTGLGDYRASAFSAVILIIGEIFALIGLLTQRYVSTESIISAIVTALTGILFAVLIFTYRGRMRRFGVQR